MQQIHQTPGPLATPKAFRRPIGAHAILVSLLLADLCGLLFWLFAGALLTPLLWWIVQGILPAMHASLLLDVGIVLILWSLAHSIFGQLVLKKQAEVAWKRTGPLIIVTIAILLLIALFRTSWMAIPAPIPAISPQPIHGWPLQLSIIGGDVAAGLAVLAHLAHLAENSLWGAFVWLPTAVALSCERRWQTMERDRVLDRDRFAWQVGEGKRLRKLLRRQLADLQKTGQPDNTVPTLAERIDHLDSLLRMEAHQVKELREAVPPALTASPTASQPSPPKN